MSYGGNIDEKGGGEECKCVLALACDDDEVDDGVNLQTMKDVDDHNVEEIVVGDELTLPKIHKSSHDVVAERVEEYCETIPMIQR